MGEDFRRRQGCDGAGSSPVAALTDGTVLFECPGRIVTTATARVCGLYQSWDQGRAIGAATVLDESATLVAALRVVGAEVNAHQEAEQRGR